MNLLFVAYSLETVGGAERVLAEVASHLADRYHGVEVLTFKERSSVDFYALHPEVRRTVFHRGDHPAPGSFQILTALPQLRAHLRATRPDVAIGFMASGYIPLALAGIRTNVPLVASEHTTYDHYHQRPFQRATLSLLTSRFKAVTTTSERVRTGFPRNIASRMIAIPNPVASYPGEARDLSCRERCVLLSVGSLRAEKGHSVLLSAFAQLAPVFAEWDLWLVGEGVERARLEQQSREMSIDQRVKFHGVVSDVAAIYAAADIFVAPSFYESFGIAAAEALAAGLPVVAFADCEGLADLVNSNINGLLVAGKDRVATLAAGLRRLMADEGARKRLGLAAPASVRQFRPDIIVDQWEEMLLAVGTGHGQLDR